MTESEYIRIREKVLALFEFKNGYRTLDAPKELVGIMYWLSKKDIKEPKTYEEQVAAATKVKQNLLKEVVRTGPFIFTEERCYFIDIKSFELIDWAWSRIPVIDVTEAAQHGFLTDFERDPSGYIKEKKRLYVFIIILCVLTYLIIQIK